MIVIKNACERLRLVLQNRALLEELRTAYGEIAVLKKALSSGGEPQQDSGAEEPQDPAASDGVKPARHQEYLKEADRFTKKTVKTS
jgi:hypothetical protein